MNTLVHIVALAAIYWGATWLFDHSLTMPGIVVSGVGLYFIASLIDVALIDVSTRISIRKPQRGRGQRR